MPRNVHPVSLLPLSPRLDLLEYLGILWPDLTSRGLRELFARGRIRHRNRPVSPRSLLGEVDSLELVGELDDLPRIPAPTLPDLLTPRLLHEDDHLIVLDKPAGLPVPPDRDRTSPGCLGWLVHRELEERRAGKPPREFIRPRLVHRIDRLTSGLLLVARTAESERELGRAFEERRIGKEYLALVRGRVRSARLTVDCPLGPARKGRRRAGMRAGDAPALTHFTVLERGPDATLLLASPRTGRMHQIRLHARAAGHPLLLDPLYGPVPTGTGEEKSPGRLLSLHSLRYSLPPGWPGTRRFFCPIPGDLAAVMRTVGIDPDLPGFFSETSS